MFNMLGNIYELFIISLSAFFIIYTVRYSCIRNIKLVFLYHAFIFVILFLSAIGGGQVINDAVLRLEQFIKLEQNNELEDARNNLARYDSKLQIDLQEFKDSNEFRNYINTVYAPDVDRAEAISIGWLYVLITEFSVLFNFILRIIKKLCRK